MTRERIEDMREVVLPFVKKRLLETNYENLGESDAEEFAKEFNEMLNLAIKALEQEPTTKNDSPRYCDRNICLKNEYNNIGCEDCEVTKSQEPTTKNNLGVDCISRQAVLDLIADYDLSMGEVVRSIHALPSVTPQEPCDKCEVGNSCLYCKHEFEPQESEDKE